MTFLQEVQEKLTSALERDLPGSKIRYVDGGWGEPLSFLAYVESPQFVGLNDARCQELVWRSILDNLEPIEQRAIDFIYTKPPLESVPSG